eukprot:TRINITY_DN29489_c0_g1_i2.p1 TRINITY_DN29489_c0_g1~~TRINITY_DN29489_c0_g1_i2.p1  ORF type:complete len:438 (+),score=130.15 TRINITY_DN29489_c0_g1_i2:911-2224(+)
MGLVDSVDPAAGEVTVDWADGTQTLARWGRHNAFDVAPAEGHAEAWQVQVTLRLTRPLQALRPAGGLGRALRLAETAGLRRLSLGRHWDGDNGEGAAAAVLREVRRRPALTEVDLGPEPGDDVARRAIAIRCADNAARQGAAPPPTLNELRALGGENWGDAAALALHDLPELLLPFWEIHMGAPAEGALCARHILELRAHSAPPPQGLMLLLCGGTLSADSLPAARQMVASGLQLPQERDAARRSPLHYAAGRRRPEHGAAAAALVDYLHGCDPAAAALPAYGTEFLPLHVAAGLAPPAVVSAVLGLYQGAAARADYRGCTPLGIIVERPDLRDDAGLAAVREVVRAAATQLGAASVRAQRTPGDITVLQSAVNDGAEGTLDVLLSAGPLPGAAQLSELLALSAARLEGARALGPDAVERHRQVARYLQRRGARPPS